MKWLDYLWIAFLALLGYIGYKHGKRVSDLEKTEDNAEILSKYQDVDNQKVEDPYKKDNW